jgi:hypothetical protein
MTLLKPGKLQELAEEIAKTEIEILALQEVRWPGKGQINKKDYLFYYSGKIIYSTIVGLRRKQAKQAQVSYEENTKICNKL